VTAEERERKRVAYERSPYFAVHSRNSSKTLGYMQYERTSVEVMLEPYFSISSAMEQTLCHFPFATGSEERDSPWRISSNA
jgi:hypothetical protein